jgi:t-SNARE complex subunit (syntaxin)
MKINFHLAVNYMKKTIEISFAITLIFISILATFIQSGIFQSIIYAVIIPSFLLSIISFITELEEKCEQYAKSFKDSLIQISNAQSGLAEIHLKQYEAGNADLPYISTHVPKNIYEMLKNSTGHMNKAVQYANIQVFCAKLKKILQVLNMMAYTFLFISLILSPYISVGLSNVNVNCITLWSLTLLFLALELKNTCAEYSFSALVKIFVKKEISKED